MLLQPKRRSGFTMVELVVAVAIIGTLVAILLPAVQRVRSTANQMACESHLRQLMIAAHSYQEAHDVFPVHMLPFRRLLPFVGQSAVYHRLENLEKTEFAVTLYLCPEDPAGEPSQGSVSYAVNEGSGRASFSKNFTRIFFDGACPGSRDWSRPKDFSDGMSQTAFFSERKIVAVDEDVTADMAAAEPNRYCWYLGRVFSLPQEFDNYRNECKTARVTAIPHFDYVYQFWLQQDYGYNHALTPNQPACHNGLSSAFQIIESGFSLLPPTSYHRGGVNVAFADGHVRFVSDTIDADIWTAISTRNADDPVPEF